MRVLALTVREEHQVSNQCCHSAVGQKGHSHLDFELPFSVTLFLPSVQKLHPSSLHSLLTNTSSKVPCNFEFLILKWLLKCDSQMASPMASAVVIPFRAQSKLALGQHMLIALAQDCHKCGLRHMRASPVCFGSAQGIALTQPCHGDFLVSQPGASTGALEGREKAGGRQHEAGEGSPVDGAA